MRAAGRSIGMAMVPAGTIAGHVLGYLMAGEDPTLSGSHSHLRPAAWTAAALAATALAVLALVAPERHRRNLRLSRLVPAQATLFGLLELAEHVHRGSGPLACLHDPCFRWGLGAQLVSAGLIVGVARLARTSGAYVRALLSRHPQPLRNQRRGRAGWHLPMVVRRLAPGSAVSERGPPPCPASA